MQNKLIGYELKLLITGSMLPPLLSFDGIG